MLTVVVIRAVGSGECWNWRKEGSPKWAADSHLSEKSEGFVVWGPQRLFDNDTAVNITVL